MFWAKKEEQPDNLFGLLNAELKRLHKIQQNEAKSGRTQDSKATWQRIVKLQNALLLIAEKQPAHDEEIKDIQETLAEMLLLGNDDVLEEQ